MEYIWDHYHHWGYVLFFVFVYSTALLFIPFYKKAEKKPATAYVAFVVAFALEMHGIPLSMYFLSILLGSQIPEGVFWGHTLFDQIGYWGMYVNIACAIIAFCLIIAGWYNIYKRHWSLTSGQREVVADGVYRYVRHPQYTGFLLLSFGMLAEWLTLPTLILFPIMIALYVRLAKREEQDMVKEFGEEYVMYMQKTKRFIPFLV